MKGTVAASLAMVLVSGLAGCLSDDSGDADDGPPIVDGDTFGPGFQAQSFDSLGLAVPQLLCFDLLEGEEPVFVDGAIHDLQPQQRCNFEMTPDHLREGNEVTIAVNPTDPQNVVGGAKDYYPPDAGECVWNGVYVTHDGGRTLYEDRSFDGSPWRLRAGDTAGFQPNYASSFWCTTDPVAYFNTEGTLYYLLMAYQTDPLTGSKTGEGVGQGALNDWAFNRATQIVAVSDDGGDTFHTFTPVFEGTYPINFADKGWIAASANGVIHVMWWSAFLPGNMYFRSTDGGVTYSDPEVLSTTADSDVVCELSIGTQCPTPDDPSGEAPVGTHGAGQGSFVDVGTGPEVYVLWYELGLVGGSSGVQMRRSFDHGATWDQQRAILDTNPVSMPTIDGRDRRGGHPQLATDRNPDSPFADALYVAWQDSCQAENWTDGCTGTAGNASLAGSAIWVAASFDKGETWGAPVRVTDPPSQDAAWKIFPTVSVSPGGVIDVSWMDARNTRWLDCFESPGHGEPDCNGQYQALTQYHAYSVDGGQTWSDDFLVRDVLDEGWDPALCHHQNGDIFIGDYNDIDSSWQAAHPVWPDTRHGHCDVYTATVLRPMFAEGWDPEARAVAEAFIDEHPL